MKSDEFCNTINTNDNTNKKMLGNNGCWFLFTFAKTFGKKFLLAIEYNIRTVDIQKPSNEAPIPSKQDRIPTIIGQNVHPNKLSGRYFQS